MRKGKSERVTWPVNEPPRNVLFREYLKISAASDDTHTPHHPHPHPTDWQKFPFSEPAVWSRSLIYFLWFLFLDELVLIFFQEKNLRLQGVRNFLEINFFLRSVNCRSSFWSKKWKNFVDEFVRYQLKRYRRIKFFFVVWKFEFN